MTHRATGRRRPRRPPAAARPRRGAPRARRARPRSRRGSTPERREGAAHPRARAGAAAERRRSRRRAPAPAGSRGRRTRPPSRSRPGGRRALARPPRVPSAPPPPTGRSCRSLPRPRARGAPGGRHPAIAREPPAPRPAPRSWRARRSAGVCGRRAHVAGSASVLMPRRYGVPPGATGGKPPYFGSGERGVETRARRADRAGA